MCYICGRDNPAGLGMTFYDDGQGTVKSIVTPAEQFQGYPGVLHGGVVAAILDEVVGRSTMSGDHHRFMMTVNMTVQYRHPVPMGEELTAIGKVVKLKGRIGKAEGQIILPDGTIACEAQLVLANMPEQIADETRIAALDWRVDLD
jgi:uncharacterized protein (TIGR00369 family)